MKKGQSKEPKIRLVAEKEAPERVVRLGDQAGVVRLDAARAPDPLMPSRLEVEETAEFETRSQEPTVDEILEESEEIEAAEVPMEQAWGGEGKRWLAVPWGWFVLVIVVCGGFALWSVRQLARNRHVTSEAEALVVEIETTELQRERDARLLYERLERRVRDYLAADSIDGMLLNLRHPERVAPLLKAWYADRPIQAADFERFETMRGVTYDRRPFWVVQALTTEGERTLLLEQTDDDDVLVDWETDVDYQPVEWDRFVAERPEGRFDFRVLVTPDNFYTHEFANEEHHRCLRLTAPGTDEYLFGYVERGSEIEKRILGLFMKKGLEVPMILKLGFLTGSQAVRSVEITEIISTRWCLVEMPEE